MANSSDRSRSFLCPELWQWCHSDDEDEYKDTNLPLQASDEFEHSQLAAAACSTTSAALLPAFFNATAKEETSEYLDSDSDSDWYTKSEQFMNDHVTT